MKTIVIANETFQEWLLDLDVESRYPDMEEWCHEHDESSEAWDRCVSFHAKAQGCNRKIPLHMMPSLWEWMQSVDTTDWAQGSRCFRVDERRIGIALGGCIASLTKHKSRMLSGGIAWSEPNRTFGCARLIGVSTRRCFGECAVGGLRTNSPARGRHTGKTQVSGLPVVRTWSLNSQNRCRMRKCARLSRSTIGT